MPHGGVYQQHCITCTPGVYRQHCFACTPAYTEICLIETPSYIHTHSAHIHRIHSQYTDQRLKIGLAIGGCWGNSSANKGTAVPAQEPEFRPHIKAGLGGKSL